MSPAGIRSAALEGPLMRLSRCPHCDSTQLIHGRLWQTSLFWLSFFRSFRISAMTCLECGVVTNYAEGDDLRHARAWGGYVARVKPAADREL